MSDAPIAVLTLDSLRQTLQQAGYGVSAVADPIATIPYLRSARGALVRHMLPGGEPIGVHPLSPGCIVSLQFGDQIVADGSGTTRLTVRCSLRIGGEDDRAAGVTCWQIRQSFHRCVGPERIEFAVEADLILGCGIALADVLGHGRDVYRHLRLLITDARETLRDIPAAARNGSAGPVLLVELKLFGDLVIGRSGLVGSSRSGLSARRLRIAAAACDWLRDAMLPDLARAVRAMLQQAHPSHRIKAGADAVAKSYPWPVVRPISFAGHPSIVPALEPVP
jgi:hypothetical protein